MINFPNAIPGEGMRIDVHQQEVNVFGTESNHCYASFESLTKAAEWIDLYENHRKEKNG